MWACFSPFLFVLWSYFFTFLSFCFQKFFTPLFGIERSFWVYIWAKCFASFNKFNTSLIFHEWIFFIALLVGGFGRLMPENSPVINGSYHSWNHVLGPSTFMNNKYVNFCRVLWQRKCAHQICTCLCMRVHYLIATYLSWLLLVSSDLFFMLK